VKVPRRRIPAAPILALVSGAILTCVYAWVLDDAFIYFRYADNAALLGAGLVFNQGEYVEGYTSPLWMLLLVGVRALHFRYWPVILTSGVAAMLVTWLLAIRVNRGLTSDGLAEFHLPALWLASCYAVQSHFTSGLETPLVQVSALAFAALVLEPGVGWLQILVGLGPVVRPELDLAFAVAVAWCWYRRRRVPWRLLGAGVLAQAAWLSFRLYYYADYVPNTFHIKVSAAPDLGIHYLHDTLRAYYLYWIVGGLLLLLGVAVVRRGFGTQQLAPRAVLWLTAAAQTAYVVRIGGDFVHYRYLAFPVLVLVASLGGIVEQALGAASRGRARAAFGLGAAFIVLIVLAYPVQLPTHPLLLRSEGDTLAMYRVDNVEDAASHRGRPDLAPREWDKGTAQIRQFRSGGDFTYRWVAGTSWCRSAYEHLDWFVVHSLGLTEPVLAHMNYPFPPWQAGHRWGLEPLANDLVRLRLAELPSGRKDADDSVYRSAVRRGDAGAWIIRNIDALDEIERRTHRPRAFWSNAARAFHGWPKVVVYRNDIAGAAWRRQ
jgi:hypothetical protein